MKIQQQNKSKALLLALTCVVSWAFIPIVARFGQNTLDNYQFLFWSSALSFIVLLISSYFSGNLNKLKNYSIKDYAIAATLGFLGSFLYYLLLYFAYANAIGLEVVALQYTWPIFIVLLSVVLLGERLTTKKIIATILGFLGVLTFITKGDFANLNLSNSYTNGLVLLAAGVFGLFSVLSKKVKYEPYSVTTIYFASATVFSYIAMQAFSTPMLPTVTSFVPLVVNGAIINGLSYVFWLKALRYADASYVAQFVFLTPVLASTLIVVFFGETLLPIYLVGMALVLGAGIITQKN